MGRLPVLDESEKVLESKVFPGNKAALEKELLLSLLVPYSLPMVYDCILSCTLIVYLT